MDQISFQLVKKILREHYDIEISKEAIIYIQKEMASLIHWIAESSKENLKPGARRANLHIFLPAIDKLKNV